MDELEDQRTVTYPPGQVPIQTVVVMGVNLESYRSRSAIKLGVCHIINGILIIACGNLAIYLAGAFLYTIGLGIMCILTGAFGMTSGMNKNRCWLITTMVFGILVAIAACGGVLLAVIGFIFANNGTHITASAFFLVFTFVEVIIGIVAARLTCGPFCCPAKPDPVDVIVSPQLAVPHGQQAVPVPPPAYTSEYPAYTHDDPPSYTPTTSRSQPQHEEIMMKKVPSE